MGWLSDIGGLAQAGAGIYSAFSGGGGDDLVREQEKSLDFVRNVAKAIQNPNHPKFKRLYEAERDAARTAFAEGIDRLLIEHERNRAKGGPGLMMSDRRDEALASSIARQREVGEHEARQAARDALTQAAGVAGVGITAAPQSIQVAQNVEQAGRERQAGGWDLVGEGLSAIEGFDWGKVLGGGSAPSVGPATPTGSAVRIS